MKLLGICLLLLAGTLCGCSAARRLTSRAKLLRTLRQLITAAMTELRTTLPLIPDLLRSLASMPDFAGLGFLQSAAENADDFPHCWHEALRQAHSPDGDILAVLETVGQTLGSTALDGQLAALELCLERLSTMQTEAEQLCKSRGHLYRSMGVLTALFFSILLL
jgi:stage III sporulation protein AB